MVSPAEIVTVCEPSSAVATKSLSADSDTVRFTARSALGASFAVTVNSAGPPSVTAEPPEIVTVRPRVPLISNTIEFRLSNQFPS